MSRDRLAGIRAQQQPTEQPYAPQQAGGYGGYDQDQPYEQARPAGDDMQSFFEEIGSIQDAIKTLNANINQIQELHNRQLTTLDSAGDAGDISGQLQSLQTSTSRLTNNLKNRIKLLETATSRLPPSGDTNVRRTQEGAVKKRFMEAIQNYQGVEKQSRDKYRQRMERQYRIVKPDATDAEVKAAVEGGQGEQVFSQALMNSNRYGDARAAYREVQDRHADIKKIEQTITELAQLFNEMSVLTQEQDEKIVQIDQQAATVEQDLGNAEGQIQKAVKSARAARKKRWICFFICLIIIAVVAIVLGVHFGTK
ncbi:t-SNARE [Atractiella rhizophila]|nr:t-SNARE [Atractiella rhizophila]